MPIASLVSTRISKCSFSQMTIKHFKSFILVVFFLVPHALSVASISLKKDVSVSVSEIDTNTSHYVYFFHFLKLLSVSMYQCRVSGVRDS